MRFLIVGVGAIGGAYLSFLTRAGHEAVGLVKRGRVQRRRENRGKGEGSPLRAGGNYPFR